MSESENEAVSAELLERLLEVKKYILENPQRLGMNRWVESSRCGTTHCVGGLMYIFAGRTAAARKSRAYRLKASPRKDRLIASSVGQSSVLKNPWWNLFALRRWPSSLADAYSYGHGYGPPTAAVRAIVTAKRIDAFVAQHKRKGVSTG